MIKQILESPIPKDNPLIRENVKRIGKKKTLSMKKSSKL